jgi:hypothetical protein
MSQNAPMPIGGTYKPFGRAVCALLEAVKKAGML